MPLTLANAIINRRFQRIAKQQDRLFGDQKVFTYYAPGAVRIAEKSSAPVKNRSHTIETMLDITGGEEGVVSSSISDNSVFTRCNL